MRLRQASAKSSVAPARKTRGKHYVWIGGAAAAVLAAIGTYATIAVQFTGGFTAAQTFWTILASAIAGIFAFLTAEAGGFALLNRHPERRTIASKTDQERKPIWGRVPPRNPTFTNRRDAMDLIRGVLTSDSHQHQRGLRSCALYGLGGVGKSTLAAEYAYRFRQEYKLVWWVRAEHAASIIEDLARLVAVLTGRTDFDHLDILTRLQSELVRCEPWLIIYDNAQGPATLREAWPAGGVGHVIVTTRADTWAELANDTITVEVFSHDGAVTLLRARTHDPDDLSSAEVAEKLGRLPLALVQAAAYVTQTKTTLQRYSRLVEERTSAVLATAPPSDYNASVATTWSMSIAEAGARARGARELLIFCSYLAPERIPRALAPEHAVDLPAPLSEIATDPVDYDVAIAALTQYSLLSADASHLSLHRLVQLTVRLSLPESEQRAWSANVVRVLTEAFPQAPRDPSVWATCAELIPHVLAAAHSSQLCSTEPTGDLLLRAGIYHVARDFLGPAADLLQMALLEFERVNGADSLDVAAVYGHLAQVLHKQARLSEALVVSLRAIRIRERLLGTNDPSLIDDLGRLGGNFRELFRLEEAEDCYQRALSIVENTYGVDDRRALPLLGFLTWLNISKGNLGTALALAERQLQVATADQDDRATAAIYFQLGSVHFLRGEYAVAQVHQSRALDLYTALDGAESYEALRRRDSLADILLALGDTQLAIELADQAIQGLTRIHGGDHPDIAEALRVLGTALLADGHPEEALQHLEHSVTIYENFYQKDHPYVAQPLVPLARTQLALGDAGAAAASLARARGIIKKTYGTHHPNYAYLLTAESTLSAAVGDQTTANQLEQEAAAIIEAARNN